MKRINRSLIFGLMFGTIAVATAVFLEIDGMSPKVFFHPVGIIAVFGGILAAALISVPVYELKRMALRTYYVIAYPRDDAMQTLREVLQVSIGMNRDPHYLDDKGPEIENVMLKDGLAFVNMGYKIEDVRKFLEVKRDQNEASLSECAIFYYSMAKMGPAFGLLGTVIGLIILLYYHMSEGNMEKIASSMGIALTATLYGVGVANMILSPLADYLQYNAERGAVQDTIIVEAVVQIKERRHPVYLLQALKSYMPREDYPEIERMMMEDLLKKDGDTGNQRNGGDVRKSA